MITPRFNCSQTESSVVVCIYCPSIRAADVEITVDKTLVTLHVNPYFLRLNFSKAVLEDDDSSAQYDPSSGYLTVTLTKETKGDAFDDLDLLAKLLAPRRIAKITSPTIEVLSSHTQLTNGVDELVSKTEALSVEDDDVAKAAENDWQLPQQLSEPPSCLQKSLQAYYGFLDFHSGYLRHAMYTENEVNELGDEAEICTKDERRSRRVNHEDEKFDEEHYMADMMDDDYIQELIQWSHPHISDHEPFQLTEKEKLAMLSLPKKEYLATPIQTHDLYLTLLTLLYAYAYESRVSQHDPTSESAWTICVLVPAFTALDPPHSDSFKDDQPLFSQGELRDTLIPSFRRSLTFPLYRSFVLAEKCRQDVALFLQKGKRTVMRCLFEIKDILDHHDIYYIYSKIWVNDFCVWIQADAADEILMKLGEGVMTCKVDKASMGFGLQELESAAEEAAARSSDSDDETPDAHPLNSTQLARK